MQTAMDILPEDGKLDLLATRLLKLERKADLTKLRSVWGNGKPLSSSFNLLTNNIPLSKGLRNMKKYIYVDESGDLGLSQRSSKFLVVSALITDVPQQLDRIIKNARRHKFKKELKKAKEIKFNKSSPALVEYIIKELTETNSCQGVNCILDKGKLYSDYLKSNKHKLYNYVAGYMARAIILDSDNVEVRIDRSKGKQLLRDDFNTYFERNLRSGSKIGEIEICHSYSENFSGIQLCDVLAGSVYQKFNNANSHYIDMMDLSRFPQSFIELWKN